MTRVLTIGGARFMGRFTVEEFRDRGDDVTLFTRGNTPIPFDEDDVGHVEGDRRDEAALRAATEAVDPDVVIDFAGFYPEDVRTALDVFSDIDTYVFVSSTSAYRLGSTVPIREGRTPLEPCSPEQAVDDTMESYGPRKAECDRLLLEADVDARIVRPTAIYGPYDPTGRLGYWIDRVRTHDRIVVPGGDYLIQGESPAVYGGRESDNCRITADAAQSGVSKSSAAWTSIPRHVSPYLFFTSFSRSYCSSSGTSM
ncbi:NAD-dependent epimerase/dehydratase family protein [Natrononativus amylolyticus]|uniref:NAD-dependent epimerase/dehydratase family protein n=1 Tax=Natrononativus amylolyticus TaxID=2963434 RepID=UPI003CE503EE